MDQMEVEECKPLHCGLDLGMRCLSSPPRGCNDDVDSRASIPGIDALPRCSATWINLQDVHHIVTNLRNRMRWQLVH